MMEQLDALKLAELLESAPTGCTCQAHSYSECGCIDAIWPEMFIKPAAKKLRRINSENDELKSLDDINAREMRRIYEQNDELKAALKVMLRSYVAVYDIGDVEMQPAIYQCRSAIAKAEGK